MATGVVYSFRGVIAPQNAVAQSVAQDSPLPSGEGGAHARQRVGG
jgi:hypothetical protein